MTADTVRQEPWPAWAKLILVALLILAVIMTLPWIFMSVSMASSCLPMMQQMRDMMGPGMMR